ncbi:MAG: choloylglycine hydrolase family protein [Ruminococcaceae bacterium]|nr:choloylglycine hydrolase family protein [Oscillospiraceae bacterium]
MCTAITYKTEDHYFGRNLDLERSYGEKVTITPRNFPLNFRCIERMDSHKAIIGMASIVNEYPLYFEGTNEAGLSMAGLNFPNNANYHPYIEGKNNITPFEFIPFILGKCNDIKETKEELESINLININFSEKLPLSPLHWLISDRESSIVVESVKSGLVVYENPVGVLTNNPTFNYHLMNLNNFMSLHEGEPENKMKALTSPDIYSLGMGALGLPGDFSSASRFIRANFVKSKSIKETGEKESVSQFFHILSSVAMPKGCVMTKSGEYEFTRYSSCSNTDRGIYYYKLYDEWEIKSVRLHSVCLDENRLFSY